MRLRDLPAPRPIPIIVGDLGDGVAWLVLRVLERGHPVIQVTRAITVRCIDDQLTHALDSAIHEARLCVGIRHGVWICHILPERSPFDDAYFLPPVAPRLMMEQHPDHISPHVINRWDVSPEDRDPRFDVGPHRWLYVEKHGRPW